MMTPSVWPHSDREGYVHDETGIYRISVAPRRWGTDRFAVVKQGEPGTSLSGFCAPGGTVVTVGRTPVRITVTRRLFRSPTLQVVQLEAGAAGEEW